MRAWSSVVSVAVLASAASGINCYSGAGADETQAPSLQSPVTTGLSYYKDVQPIIAQSCLGGCHVNGGIAPFSLETYADVKAHAAGVVAETTAQRMPPWGALETDECKPTRGWKNDLRIQKPQLDALSEWVSGGTREGDVADRSATAGAAPATSLPGVEQELLPNAPFVAAGDKDEFRCFALDPKLTEDKYINGAFVVAGNAKVVHHVLLFSDPNGESVKKGPQYDCFGGPDVSNSALLAVWAPGGVPAEYEPNLGTPIKAGSKMVMQVHYHPGGRSDNAPDTTKIQLRYTKGKPEYSLIPALIGNITNPVNKDGNGLLPDPDDRGTAEFRIPAGVANHRETMQFFVPATVPEASIYFIGSHMHWVGQDMKIDVERTAGTAANPKNECLLQTPRYNFSWQRTYTYKSAITDLPKVHAGDKLTLRCGYNNTMDNSQLQVALQEQRLSVPKDVVLGETTLDEMCLAALGVVVKN